MNRLLVSHRLIVTLLLAVFVSVFTLPYLPTAAASTKGNALIALAHRQPTAGDLSSNYTLLAMDGKGNTKSLATPATLNHSTDLPLSANGGAVFYLFLPPNHIEVIDLAKGTDKLYPAPPDPAVSLMMNPVSPTSLPVSAVALEGGKRLLFGGDTDTWYILDLASGSYTTITVSLSSSRLHYYPFAQSPADGLIYANWGCRCDAPPGGVARYDLQGKGEMLDLHLGKYVQASGPVMSPAGFYLYFLAQDPDQPVPPPNGPGVFANVIMRYRISDGSTSVVARAGRGNVIGTFTLTSADPNITYTEGVPNPNSSTNAEMSQRLIRRVNLATNSTPQTLLTASHDVYPLLWCGSNLYYGGYEAGKSSVHSYSLTSHKAAQTEGQLIGCAP